MKTVKVDGQDCITFMSEADDGGMIISTLVPTGQPNEYREHRSWIGRGFTELPDGTIVQPTDAETTAARNQARTLFASLDANTIRARVTKAKTVGNSGKLSKDKN